MSVSFSIIREVELDYWSITCCEDHIVHIGSAESCYNLSQDWVYCESCQDEVQGFALPMDDGVVNTINLCNGNASHVISEMRLGSTGEIAPIDFLVASERISDPVTRERFVELSNQAMSLGESIYWG